MKPLADLPILITRPAHQAQGLVTALQEKGAVVTLMPTIAIQPARDQSSLQQALAHIHSADILIFTSANAVNYVPRLSASHCLLFAVGSATQKCLQAADWGPIIVPLHFNSESLLGLPLLQSVAHKKIIIFGGANPRPLLQQTLQARGATVHYAICYERVLPPCAQSYHTQLALLQNLKIIVTTSNEALRNLFTLVDTRLHPLLRQLTFVIVSPRMLTTLQNLGCQKPPIVADNATDNGIITSLIHRYTQKEPPND